MGGEGYERNESEAERHDRHWNELLQELRLAQTGTQILFAFLLVIAFTPPFRDSDATTHWIYAVTLLLTAMATGLLLAPVSLHRVVFRRRVRDRLVAHAGRMAAGGMFLLLLAMCGSVMLALDVVVSRPLAAVGAVGVFVWFAIFWYVVSAITRRR